MAASPLRLFPEGTVEIGLGVGDVAAGRMGIHQVVLSTLATQNGALVGDIGCVGDLRKLALALQNPEVFAEGADSKVAFLIFHELKFNVWRRICQLRVGRGSFCR
jgi:hypothetical protein